MGVYTIYAIHCLHSDRVYIGCSRNLAGRIAQHRVSLRAQNHPNIELQRDYNLDPASFEIVGIEQLEGTLGEARLRERHWVQHFGPRVYNRKLPVLPASPLTFDVHEIAQAIRQGLTDGEICLRCHVQTYIVEEVRQSPFFSYL